MSTKINIGVTGTGSLIGQAIIKSVQRSSLNDKINCVGFDYFESTVGSFWCNKNYVLPDILKDRTKETFWLETIVNVVLENKIRLLFIGVDFELILFAKYKKEIEEKTNAIVMVSSSKVIEIADDKYLTYKFLKENNLFHPESYLPDQINYEDLQFPMIVKPRVGARSVGVSKIFNADSLRSAIQKLKEPIIQECIGNDQEEFTCGVIFLNDEIKQTIVLRRTLKEGNTFLSYFKNDFPDIITEYVKNVAVHLQPFGACNFQLRLDEKGIPKIFEINSRHSGTTYIRSLFGFMEIEYIINQILFNKELKFQMKEGTVVRFVDEFFVD
ncbi:MAG: ATP-grasp domain-containing protein [Bacteroidia bacterium]